MPTDASFAEYCCELLRSVGRCTPRRMFGGWGISTGGLTIAIVADLGSGQTLYLKANENTRPLFEQAGCERFTYATKGGPRSVDYYSAPQDALESPQLMAPWARQALDCALKAQSAKVPRRTATTSQASRATPAAKRAAAPAPKARASRKSAKG
jgi:DNA transformation protein and related proteins